jgi:hypothetical protein
LLFEVVFLLEMAPETTPGTNDDDDGFFFFFFFFFDIARARGFFMWS